jgi:hypothetical protein
MVDMWNEPPERFELVWFNTTTASIFAIIRFAAAQIERARIGAGHSADGARCTWIYLLAITRNKVAGSRNASRYLAVTNSDRGRAKPIGS